VDDVSVALEHIHLLNGLNGLDIELLQSLLQLLVVTTRPGRRALDLSPGGSLATVSLHVRISALSLRMWLTGGRRQLRTLHTLQVTGRVASGQPCAVGSGVRDNTQGNIPMRAEAPSFFNRSWTSDMV